MKHVALVIAVLYLGYTFIPQPEQRDGDVAAALLRASTADKRAVSEFYRAMADVTKRDGGERIPNLQVWREMHRDALGLAFGGTDLVGKYKGLDIAIDQKLQEAAGLDNVPLPQVSDKLVDACKEIAADAR